MTKPAQVLDEQGALLSRALDPNYEAMATWMLSSILAKSHMQSPEWAQGARPALTAHWREMVVPSLAAASAYHVSTEMLTLARWAGHLLPDDVALQADDLPTASGFLMFEDALEGMEVWGRKTYTHALFWRSMTSKFVQYGDGRPGIELYAFNSMRDTRDEVTQRILRDYAQGGKDAEWHLAKVGHLNIDHVVPVGFGEAQPALVHTPETYGEDWAEHRAVDWAEGRSPIPDNENWVRTVMAIFNLMNQTVADTREIDVDRHAAKRARRMNLPARVTVIHLRRMEGSKSDHESDVEWQHRWVVRGHWRNQPYGPKDNQEVRRIWIAPYVKGPEDRPFVVTDKVYTLDR